MKEYKCMQGQKKIIQDQGEHTDSSQTGCTFGPINLNYKPQKMTLYIEKSSS